MPWSSTVRGLKFGEKMYFSMSLLVFFLCFYVWVGEAPAITLITSHYIEIDKTYCTFSIILSFRRYRVYNKCTLCPRSSYPFYIVTYCTTSWTDGMYCGKYEIWTTNFICELFIFFVLYLKSKYRLCTWFSLMLTIVVFSTICPRSSYPFCIVTYYM